MRMWSANRHLRLKHVFPREVGWNQRWPYRRAMSHRDTLRWNKLKWEAMELQREFEWSA